MLGRRGHLGWSGHRFAHRLEFLILRLHHSCWMQSDTKFGIQFLHTLLRSRTFQSVQVAFLLLTNFICQVCIHVLVNHYLMLILVLPSDIAI